MGFVEIHASEGDVEKGCLLGTMELLVVLVHYMHTSWTNAVTIMSQRGENPFPQYTPSTRPQGLPFFEEDISSYTADRSQGGG